MFSKGKWKITTCSVLAISMVLATAGCSKSATKETTTVKSTSTTEAKKTEAPKPTFKPEKTITAIVMAAAGGSTDLLARAVEKVWSKHCPQPIQIVNKTAGGGVEGAVAVARSKPDGYTMLIGYGSGQDITMPHIQKVEYDPFKDLEPVVRLSVHSVVVAVPPNSPFKSIKDVVEWAKKEKKPVTAAVSTSAGAVDLVMRGIGKAAGIEVTPVPHSGSVQSITTVMGGQTMIGGGHPADIINQIKANRLILIAIATPERDPILKDIPTLREQGINFHTWGSVKGVAVPKKTPPEIITYYEDLFKKICEDEEFKKAMADMAQPVQYQNAAAFTKFFKEAFDDYGKLIKELGIEPSK